MKAAIVIPYYDHGKAIEATVAALREHGLPCWLVDDGSHPEHADAARAVAAQESTWLHLIRQPFNQGKGAAAMAGFSAAFDAGCSHAIQIDADGQHNAADLPRFLEASQRHPAAVVCGIPEYDDSVPAVRFYGRYLTHALVWLNTLSFAIKDSMCGFRLYPLAPTLQLWQSEPVGRRMQFDSEIIVRLFWAGVPVINLPTRVTYPSDGVSHFDMLRDNLRMASMHGRLFLGMLWRLPRLLTRRKMVLE